MAYGDFQSIQQHLAVANSAMQPVHSWARLRAQMYGQFANVYMNDSALASVLCFGEGKEAGDEDQVEESQLTSLASKTRSRGHRSVEVASSKACLT